MVDKDDVINSVMKECPINEFTIGYNNPSFIPSENAKEKAYYDKNDENIADERLEGFITEAGSPLVYKISDSTPIHLTLFFALQQALCSLSTSLAVSLLVAQVVCADDDEEFKAKLLSSTLFMNGFTTICMVIFGVRLPMFQGATAVYVVPLIALADVQKDMCQSQRTVFNETSNTTQMIDIDKEQLILEQVQMLQGSLVLVGVVHCLIGATGLVGILLRFIGPVTIVPTILMTGIVMVKSIAKFAHVDWAVSVLTCALAIILSLYLAKFDMPIPVWNRKKSCHIIRYPFHKVFSALIALVIGWMVCLILTETGYYDHATNKTSKEYYARTDMRSYVIKEANWFNFPYPGQFGPFGFSVSIFIGYLIATFISILDSVGDYYACAATCHVPPPPSHAVNRGIATEGLCTALSGAVGCGHATSTYGVNVGVIGLTKVASRHVIILSGVIYVVFGVIGKISAVFITIPHPVLGGLLLIMFGAFNGVVLSNLKAVDLSSTRNVTIIGTALLVGLVVPHWVEKYPGGINTGSSSTDNIMAILLGNPNLNAGILSCFLDNTIPGSQEERGITAWQADPVDDTDCESKSQTYVEGREVYMPLLPAWLLRHRAMKYIPFLPYQE